MKFYPLLYTFSLCLFISVADSQAQSRETNKELVLQTTKIKTSNVLHISKQLSALDGVLLRGYHAHSRALLITYDETKLIDPTIIISAVEHLNKGICIKQAFYENLYTFIDRVDSHEPSK